MTVRRELNESATRRDVEGALDALTYDGGYPYLGDAMRALTTDVFTEATGDRVDATNYAVVLSGGRAYGQDDMPLAEATRYRGVHMFVVNMAATGSGSDDRRLNAIVAEPELDVFRANSIGRATETVEKIVAYLCESKYTSQGH